MPYAVALILASLAAEPDAPYAWPLDLPRVLTSSFAEYRPGRFHMGIDLRTGPIGKDVFAASDGYVSRVRCSPYGYGKAIYVFLEDGNTAIYAHLDDFIPELRDYLRRAQHDRKKYTVDLYPDPGEFPVTRGQLIAKSGQTGIGVPHLHYELRDRFGVPINPRLLGVDWPDTGAPAFRGAVVVPVEAETLINGDMLPVVLRVQKRSAGVYVADSVRVSGPVAFGVDVVDPANGGGTRLGVRTIRTTAGETEIFRMEHDRVTYTHAPDGVVAYHPFLMDEGRFLMQWRWPGNESEIFTRVSQDGRFQPTAQSDAVSIVAEDFHRNRASLTIPITYAPESSPAEPSAENSALGVVEYDYLPEWLVVTARFPRAEAELPVLQGWDSAATGGFRRVGARTFRAAVVPEAGVTALRLSVEHPRIEDREDLFIVSPRGESRQIVVGDQVHVETQTDSAYGTMFIRVEEVVPDPGSALRALGPAYLVGDPRTPVDASVSISLAVPAGASNPDRVHVFREGRKGWELQNSELRDGRLWINTTQLGIFAVMEDPSAPTIRRVRPRSGQRFNTRRPTIRASIADTGSAISEFSATYNGRWLLMEYDPEQQKMEWEQDEDLPVGEGTVEFRVTDGAGNVSVERVSFEVLPGAR